MEFKITENVIAHVQLNAITGFWELIIQGQVKGSGGSAEELAKKARKLGYTVLLRELEDI